MIVTQTRDDTAHRGTSPVGKSVLFSDGTFLLVAGSLGMLFDLLGHAGIGSLARAFVKSPYTAGFVEAHGMAVLASMLLYRGAALEKKRFWHLYAVMVHLLLGGTNLHFWGMFSSFGLVPLGVITTAAHGVFVIAQCSCFVLARRDLHSWPDTRRYLPVHQERINSWQPMGLTRPVCAKLPAAH
jgi:hypothetical protein